MKQNIYDNPRFYAGYNTMREAQSGLNEVLEQPAMSLLLPENIHGNILDLGCGDGGQCEKLLNLGADSVVGVDISQNMIQAAKKRLNGCDHIKLHCISIEDFTASENSFDIIVSSLAFHYVADIESLFHNIHTWLKDSGLLIFSIEHPIATCSQGIHPGWHRNENNEKTHWQVDSYSDESERKSHWFVDDVIKYHRKISTIANALIDSGFCILRMLEPHALETAEKEKPSLLEERKRPPFLLIKARKI